MKRCTLIILFLSINSFAQQYDFNIVQKSKWKRKYVKPDDKINLFNTADYSYSLEIINHPDGLWARIFDTKRNFIHNFTIKPKDSLRLVYVNSIKWNYIYKNIPTSFSEPIFKKDKTFINYYIKNSKHKIVGKYKLEIQKDSIDLFTPFKITGVGHPFEYSNTKPPFNFKVISSSGQVTENVQENKNIINLTETRKDSIDLYTPNTTQKHNVKENKTPRTTGQLISVEFTELTVSVPKKLKIIEKLPVKNLGIIVE